MADRIETSLSMDVSAFVRGARDAVRAVDEVADATDKAGKKGQELGKKAGQGGKDAEKGLKQAGAAADDAAKSAEQLGRQGQKAGQDTAAAADEAASATREVGSAARAAGDQATEAASSATRGLGSWRDMARENQAEMRTLGGSMLGIGAAATGIAVAVAKTGIEYNTLQQTSRAAMTTLLGGAEQANAQMDKLDAFARTSPFSKAVFIQAQQQMIGFGIETRKVVPYLEAVQDAVAAAGGSNQKISEIVDILAKIKSQGKITARELMQLGVNGIDAATLIGEAMGKTGAQIREEITAGALDADTALDALTRGMSDKFGGAAANVKSTMTGALDRVKAAFRDLSASAIEPLVSQTGGGILVSATNGLADLIRKFDELPGPVKTGAGALTGLVGLAATGAGSFLLLAPRIVQTSDALDILAKKSKTVATLQVLLRGLKFPVAAAGIAALAAGFAFYSKKVDEAKARTESYASAIQSAQGDVADMQKALYEQAVQNAQTGETMDWGWVQKLNAGFQSFSDTLDLAGVSIHAWGKAVSGTESEQTAFRDRLKDIYVAGQITGGQFQELSIKFDQQAGASNKAKEAAKELNEAQADSVTTIESVTEEVNAQTEALLELMGVTKQMGDSALSVREAQRGLAEAVASASEVIEKNGANLDLNTEAGRSNQKALDDIASAGWKLVDSMSDATDANGRAKYSTEEVQGAMSNAREEFIAAAEAAGYSADEARGLADDLGLIPKDVVSRVSVQDQASDKIAQIQRMLGGLTDRTVTITTHYMDSRPGAPGYSMAGGGAVFGPGTTTSDDIPVWLSNFEHVWPAVEVKNLGGHGNMYALRSMVRNRPNEVRQALGLASGGTPSNLMTVPVYNGSNTPTMRVSLEGLRVEGRLSVDGRVFGDLVDARFVSGPVGGGLAGVGAASRSHGGSRPGSI